LDGSTPFHLIAEIGNLEGVEAFIQAGVNVNIETDGCSAPLYLASMYDHTDCMTALIQAGADVNLQNNEGNTALHSAAVNDHIDSVKLLLQNGADPTIQNQYGFTPEKSAEDYPAIQAVFRDYRISQEQKTLREVPMPENLPERHTPRIGRGRL